MCDNSVISTENYTYDAAGNVTDAPDSCFEYDTNNRLIAFEGRAVSYDPDGNMLSNGSLSCTYDSANRLLTAGGHTYTYNAEDVRIRNLCADADTTYTYDTNGKLSRLLTKTTNGITTKYVYGLGLIGEEKESLFKTYHFDNRGSTVAITNEDGTITDRLAYDTYGKLISHTGSSFVIFGYNGRDGVVTDRNGLIYMRARYYSPAMKRFVNADVVAGAISNAITLNRYAYANGNPVTNVDPFGLSADERVLYYENQAYEIFVPSYSGKDDFDGWTTVYDVPYWGKNEIDWNRFMLGLITGADDMDGIANGTNPNVSSTTISGIVAGYALLRGALDSAANSSNRAKLRFLFQEKDGKRRVIITSGTTEQREAMQSAAGTSYRACSKASTGSALAWTSHAVRNLYTGLTGNDAGFGWYDMFFSVDAQHKDAEEFYYVFPDQEGNLVTSAILYPGDRAAITKGFFKREILLELPLHGNQKMSTDFLRFFDEALSEKNIQMGTR